jgi:hypothetical protein
MPGLNSELNTPAKRIWALVTIAGVLLVAIGLAQFLGDYFIFDVELVLQRGPLWGLQNLGKHSYALGAFLLWLGLAAVLAGMLMSFLYDQTVGKIVHWVRTGSLPATQGDPPAAQDLPATQCLAPRRSPDVLPIFGGIKLKPSRPAQPPPALAVWIGDAFVLLVQSWLTALVSFAAGGIHYLDANKPQHLLTPAGIALIFWLRPAIGSLLTADNDHARGTFVLLGIKLMIAYIFFAVGFLVLRG